MPFSLYQIILICLSAGFIVMRTKKFINKEQGQTLYKLAVTYALWLGVVLVSIFPNDVGKSLKLLGLGENFNTLIFLVFIVVFVLIFKVLELIENLERTITELVRRDALMNIKKIGGE